MGPPPDATTKDSALLAPAAPRPTGSISAQAATLAKTASGTGAQAEGALRTALELSGIELTDLDGRVVDATAKPTLGIAVPAGEVLYISGQNTDAHGMNASDFAAVLALLGGKRADPARFQQALLDGLRNLTDADYPATSRFLGSFIADLGRDGPDRVDLSLVGDNDVRFTGLQSWLLYLGLATGFAQAAALEHAGRPAPSASPHPFVAPALTTDSTKNCDTSGTTGEVLDWSSIGLGGLSTGVGNTDWGGAVGGIDDLRQTANPSAGSVGDNLEILNIALSLARVVAESTTLKGTIEMEGGQPLHRTKSNKTGDYTEDKVLRLHATFDLGKGQYANCLRTALNLAGLDFSLPNDGPVPEGVSVQWSLYNDDGGVANNPVVFEPHTEAGIGARGDSVQSTTDKNGDALMHLQGQPQKHRLPPDTKPYMRSVRIIAALQLKGNEIYGDLKDALSTIETGGLGAVAQVLTSLVERTHSLSIQQVFQVQDWQKDFKIDGDAQYFDPGCECFPHVTALKCDGLDGTWTLHGLGHSTTFELDENGRGSTPGHGLGTFQIEYRPGPPPKLELHSPLAEQAFPVIPGDFVECGNES